MPSTDMQAFRVALQSSQHVVALAGAGLSAASGIKTFRGTGGLWRRHDAMRLATPEAFAADPSLVWQFYAHRRRIALAATPNAGHRALARVADRITLVTQNVDGLSRRAGAPTGSDLYEMHGCLLETRCTRCGDVQTPPSGQDLCPALNDTVNESTQIAVDDLPHCTQARCDGLLRPNVVWFGEQPQHLPTIYSLLSRPNSLLLVVGTSSLVYPAAGFADHVKRHGGKVAVFNIAESEGDQDADFLFLGPAEESLDEALAGF